MKFESEDISISNPIIFVFQQLSIIIISIHLNPCSLERVPKRLVQTSSFFGSTLRKDIQMPRSQGFNSLLTFLLPRTAVQNERQPRNTATIRPEAFREMEQGRALREAAVAVGVFGWVMLKNGSTQAAVFNSCLIRPPMLMSPSRYGPSLLAQSSEFYRKVYCFLII